MDMQKTKIAFFDAKPYDVEFFDTANASFGFDFSYFDTRLTHHTVLLAQGHEVACLFVHDNVDAKLAKELYDQGIRLLALRSNGYNHIDIQATKNLFPVVRVPRYSPYAVAEYTVGLLLSLNRKIHHAYWRTKTFNFSLQNLIGFDMHGKTAGVIGTGQIGALVAKLLHGFGMNVLAYDPFPSKELQQSHILTYVPLEQLYRQSDIITLHCPLMPETKNILSKSAFDCMKKGVLIVNTSRGGLLQTSDLIDSLKQKKIGGAALDVYEEEDRFFFEDFSDTCIDDDVLARLLSFPNVIVTSHQAFFTKEAMIDIANETLNNINAFVQHRPLINQVQ